MAHVLAKDLRNAILHAGMTGKLTIQSSKDTPVLQTLEAIKKDRESRISQKQIKKDKRLDYVEFEDTRFDIPDSWKWTTLGAVLYKLTDGTHKTPKYTECGVKFVSVKDMSTGCLSLARTKYISEKEHLELFSRCNPEKGDILLSKVGTTGVPAIVDTDEKFSLFVSVALLKFNDALINREFLYRLLQSPDVQFQAAENTKGIGNKNWVLDKIANTEIPLPPIEEQQRIVDRVNELMAKIDEYEKLENQLVQLKEQFPKDMRDSLLQAAIQGKLTKQLKNDTSVEEILKSIEEQKKTLIKEDKLQKKKSFHLIRNDEIPFDIPDNWVFAKLGYISTYDEEKQKINARDANDNLWMLDLEDIAKGGTLLCKKRVFERKAIGDKTIFEKGSILYSKLRPYLLKILIADEDGICTPELVPFKMYGRINTSYIALFLKSPYVDSEINKVTYGVKMPRVGTKTMVNFYVPLPPIEEQQRIVDKLDEMLPLVDALAQMD